MEDKAMRKAEGNLLLSLLCFCVEWSKYLPPPTDRRRFKVKKAGLFLERRDQEKACNLDLLSFFSGNNFLIKLSFDMRERSLLRHWQLSQNVENWIAPQ